MGQYHIEHIPLQQQELIYLLKSSKYKTRKKNRKEKLLGAGKIISFFAIFTLKQNEAWKQCKKIVTMAVFNFRKMKEAFQ